MSRCIAHRFQILIVWLPIAAIVAPLLASGDYAHAQIVIVPTTTLARETGNNTSASSSFMGLPNDTPAPGNVSKSNTSTLLYPGATTRMFAHLMGWFGSPSHISVGYLSNDPAQVQRQVTDMKSRGFAGAILDWYGQGTNMSNLTAPVLRDKSAAQGFRFALNYDVGAVRDYATDHICDVTQQVINDLNYGFSNYEQSSAYLRAGAYPVVFFFGLEAYYVDWKAVRSQVTGSPLFVFRNRGGITDPNANGGFAWQTTNMNDPYDMSLTYLDGFYATAVANPQKLIYGSAYPGFNDTVASWTGNRVQHRQCGLTWLKTMAETGKYYSSTRQLQNLQSVTWNDYEEGTAVEPGISNCIDVFASMSGSILNWKLTGTGSPSTVAYYRVFISLDGTNLMKLKDVSSGSRSLDLSAYALSTSTTYTMYVKAVGRASIQNHMSGPVTYRRGNKPPVFSLAVSPTSGIAPLTVKASASGAYDPDGSLSRATIDFGDGAVISGFSGSHTYQQFDQYTITARVYDNRGVATIKTAQVIAKPPRTGVIIWTPQSGSNVPNIFHLVATASSASTYPITNMKVYIDNSRMFTIKDDRIDTRFRLYDGWHKITVNAWDSTGVVYAAKTSVLVGIGTNDVPHAAVAVTNTSPAVGQSIRACTAPSSDSEGIGVSVVDFGDGTAPQRGVTTYHAYSAPGTYTLKATVTDLRGASATTTTTVNVH